MKIAYNQQPLQTIEGKNRQIAVFETNGENIAAKVVQSFGDEWLKFQDFTDKLIADTAKEYFDVLNESIVNKNTYALDIGCGTGRWTKYLSQKAGFVEAMDPSNAIFAADNLLGTLENVRLTKASTETIPFDDEAFDFVMSVGVLHHIPDTRKAMEDCVKKVKRGGYFYCYLYHNLESLNWFSKILFWLSELIRKVVSKLPYKIKSFVCDILAVVIYMPIILLGRLLILTGLKNIAAKMPLNFYHNKTFFMVRNDSLDKFGTSLENRFSKEEVSQLMENCGLTDIVISNGIPYYHAVGKKDK
jgi:ubiquinone/menaquinone biosynthesis C-methylase UbiE